MKTLRTVAGVLLGCVSLVVSDASDARAQQPIQPVPMTPFGGGQDSVLMSELAYRIGDTNHIIIVPAGFVTDFASTPRAIWSVLPPTGRYQMAAIVHDFLYWEQQCTREQADSLLRVAMAESLVGPFKRDIIWRAVRDFGDGAWKANARAKADGQPRIIARQRFRFLYLSHGRSTELSFLPMEYAQSSQRRRRHPNTAPLQGK
jgi:Protein of unknown function (DUF1353)